MTSFLKCADPREPTSSEAQPGDEAMTPMERRGPPLFTAKHRKFLRFLRKSKSPPTWPLVSPKPPRRQGDLAITMSASGSAHRDAELRCQRGGAPRHASPRFRHCNPLVHPRASAASSVATFLQESLCDPKLSRASTRADTEAIPTPPSQACLGEVVVTRVARALVSTLMVVSAGDSCTRGPAYTTCSPI